MERRETTDGYRHKTEQNKQRNAQNESIVRKANEGRLRAVDRAEVIEPRGRQRIARHGQTIGRDDSMMPVVEDVVETEGEKEYDV